MLGERDVLSRVQGITEPVTVVVTELVTSFYLTRFERITEGCNSLILEAGVVVGFLQQEKRRPTRYRVLQPI